MRFEAEIVVRASGEVVQESLHHDGPKPAQWTEADVRAVVTAMLMSVDRAAGRANSEAAVSMRGLSWIVSPFDEGVAIAIEIPSGSVIAGPFSIPEATLTGFIRDIVADDNPPRT